MGFKQHTTSVIGKLMGLDELPPPQHAQKHRRVLSDKYFKRVAAIGILEKHIPGDCHSTEMETEELNDLKDAFAVSGKRERSESSSVKAFDSHVRRSINENQAFPGKTLRTPRKPQDLLEVIDLINISPGNVQERGSIFNNQFYDRQGVLPNLQSQETLFLKSSSTFKGTVPARKSWGKTEHGHANLCPKMEGRNLSEPSRSFMKAPLPTSRIVVLKPKSTFGKLDNVAKISASSSSPEDSYKGSRGFLGLQNENSVVDKYEKKTASASFGIESNRKKLGVPWEILNGISQKKRHRVVGFPLKTSTSAFISGDAFRKESQLMGPSFPNESFVAREARKHIIERWETTEKIERAEKAHSGGTLGEMLALPPHVSSLSSLNSKVAKRGRRNQTFQAGGHVSSGCPLCISRRNCGKYQIFHSASVIATPRTQIDPEYPQNRPCLGPEKSTLRNDHTVDGTFVAGTDLKIKAGKETCSQKLSVPKSSRCSVYCSGARNTHAREDKWVIKPKHKLQEDSAAYKGLHADVVAVADSDVSVTSSLNLKEKIHGPAACNDDDSSSLLTDNSSQQESSVGFSEEGSVSSHCSGTEQDSLQSVEELYQPSPISVLEPLYTDENSSSSESLKKTGIDINGLQMQLELLVSESSEMNREGPETIVSSEDDCGEGAVGIHHSEESMSLFTIQESREFSYVVDVLTEAGLHGSTMDTSLDAWHSLECPIALSVFETLEEKFGVQKSWKRSERRLLFDQINSGLVEIFQLFTHNLAKPVSRFWPPLDRKMVEEELWILPDSKGMKTAEEVGEELLWKGKGWSGLEECINAISGELEAFLINEVAGELVIMES